MSKFFSTRLFLSSIFITFKIYFYFKIFLYLAVARSWSGYMLSLFGSSHQNSTIVTVGHFNVCLIIAFIKTMMVLYGCYNWEKKNITSSFFLQKSFFVDSPDLIAFLVVVTVSTFTGLGTKTTTNFNSLFTVINILVNSLIILKNLKLLVLF